MTRLGLFALLLASTAHAGTYDVKPEVGGLPSGDGTARTLRLHFVNGFTHAPDGTLYVGGYYASAVWHVLADGSAQVVAGVPGVYGYEGDGALATAAHLSAVSDVAIAANGDVYIADFLNWKVRKVDHATGLISTIAGTGVEPWSVDGPGGDASDDSVDGAQATSMAVAPLQIAIANGALYIADQDLPRVIKIDLTSGVGTVVAGSGVETYSIDGPGGDASDDLVSGTDARQAAFSFAYGGGMAVAADGTLYIADTGDCVIRKVHPTTHVVTTIAGNGEQGYGGDGGVATAAMFDNPYDVALGPDGAVYVSDQFNNRIRRIANGNITTVAGTGAHGWAEDDGMPAIAVAMAFPRGLEVSANGTLYFADSFNHRVRGVLPSGGVTTVAGMPIGNNVAGTSSQLDKPQGLAAGPNASLLVADSNNYRVRSFENGLVRTIAGSGFPFFAGDGGPALAAGMRAPTGVAANTAGDVFFTDVRNGRIRKIDHVTGTITTIASSLSSPLGIAVDSSGRVVFVEAGNNRIARIATNGTISTVTTTTESPEWLALDSADNIFFTEDSHTIKRIDHATSAVTTIAGTGAQGFAGDGGPAIAAQLDYPLGIAIGGDGAIWFIDSEGTRVRRIATDGTISTVAGTGSRGLPGNMTSAGLSTALDALFGIAVTSDGVVHVVADQRIFQIVPHVEPMAPDAGIGDDAGTEPPPPPIGDDGGCGCDGGGGLAGLLPALSVAAMLLRRRVRSRRASPRRDNERVLPM